MDSSATVSSRNSEDINGNDQMDEEEIIDSLHNDDGNDHDDVSQGSAAWNNEARNQSSEDLTSDRARFSRESIALTESPSSGDEGNSVGEEGNLGRLSNYQLEDDEPVPPHSREETAIQLSIAQDRERSESQDDSSPRLSGTGCPTSIGYGDEKDGTASPGSPGGDAERFSPRVNAEFSSTQDDKSPHWDIPISKSVLSSSEFEPSPVNGTSSPCSVQKTLLLGVHTDLSEHLHGLESPHSSVHAYDQTSPPRFTIEGSDSPFSTADDRIPSTQDDHDVETVGRSPLDSHHNLHPDTLEDMTQLEHPEVRFSSALSLHSLAETSPGEDVDPPAPYSRAGMSSERSASPQSNGYGGIHNDPPSLSSQALEVDVHIQGNTPAYDTARYGDSPREGSTQYEDSPFHQVPYNDGPSDNIPHDEVAYNSSPCGSELYNEAPYIRTPHNDTVHDDMLSQVQSGNVESYSTEHYSSLASVKNNSGANYNESTSFSPSDTPLDNTLTSFSGELRPEPSWTPGFISHNLVTAVPSNPHEFMAKDSPFAKRDAKELPSINDYRPHDNRLPQRLLSSSDTRVEYQSGNSLPSPRTSNKEQDTLQELEYPRIIRNGHSIEGIVGPWRFSEDQPDLSSPLMSNSTQNPRTKAHSPRQSMHSLLFGGEPHDIGKPCDNTPVDPYGHRDFSLSQSKELLPYPNSKAVHEVQSSPASPSVSQPQFRQEISSPSSASEIRPVLRIVTQLRSLQSPSVSSGTQSSQHTNEKILEDFSRWTIKRKPAPERGIEWMASQGFVL